MLEYVGLGIPTNIVHDRQNMEINQSLLSMKEKKTVDLPTNIVQARHIREIYHPILSSTDKTG